MLVTPPTASEKRIIELCNRVIVLTDQDELTVAITELKAALHDHVTEAKARITPLARMLALKNERSKKAPPCEKPPDTTREN